MRTDPKSDRFAVVGRQCSRTVEVTRRLREPTRVSEHVPEKLGGGMLTMLERYEGITNVGEYFGSMKAGELHRQPELAATLRRIADNGIDEFYRGETAELLVAEMERGDGLITMEDLDLYEAKWREPVRGTWNGFEVVSSPPPSSGGFGLIQLLKMKEMASHLFVDVPHNSTQYVHLVAEISKRDEDEGNRQHRCRLGRHLV